MSVRTTGRICWSMAWRTALFGIAIGYLAAIALPASPIGETVRMRTHDDLAMYFSPDSGAELSYADAYQTVLHHTQRAVREEGIFSYAYAYELLRGLVPAMLASFLAACMVLKKNYAAFSVRVVHTNGTPRSPFWWPAIAFTGLIYAPFFALTVLYYAVPLSAVITSWIVIYLAYLTLCIVGWFAMIRLALRFEYRSFRPIYILTRTPEVAA